MTLQSLKDFDRNKYWRFLQLFRHLVGIRSKRAAGQKAAKDIQRREQVSIGLSGVLTHDSSVRVTKIHVTDGAR
jgi:hypothetical protein